MAEEPIEDLAHQIEQHIASLQAAGVQWIPNGGDISLPIPVAAAIPTARPVAPPTFVASTSTSAERALSAEDRRRELLTLAARVSTCTRCAELAKQRTLTVFGVGPVDPELCFVGEAPGYDEDKQGEPFVGDAGQLLDRIIAACGLTRGQVYICNIIKCRPPGNRLPMPDEAANCREYLVRQIELVRPKFICALGACAAQNLLDTKRSIGLLRGQFYEYRGIPVMCTYHPAYLLRTPEKKKDVWEDLKKLLERMGRPIPGR